MAKIELKIDKTYFKIGDQSEGSGGGGSSKPSDLNNAEIQMLEAILNSQERDLSWHDDDFTEKMREIEETRKALSHYIQTRTKTRW